LPFWCGTAFAADPVYGGRLTVGTPYPLEPINPFFTRSSLSANILELLFDPLINLGRAYEMEPLLAEKWDVSADRLTWKFTLRDGVAFHDGEPLTSEDVVFTFQSLIAQRNPIYRHVTDNIESVTSEDDRTVSFKLKRSDRIFPFFLRRAYIVPSHLFQEDGQPTRPDDAARPVGSGAFRSELISTDEIVLKANPDYFRGRPFLDEIRFQVVPGDRALLAKLMSGEIDVHIHYDFRYLPTIEDVPHLQLFPYDSQNLYALFFNAADGLFSDPRVRQALNYAVDKAGIRDAMSSGNMTVAAGLVQTKSPWYDSSVEPYLYDPQKAGELLSSMGWRRDESRNEFLKNGEVFEFEILTPQEGGYADRMLQKVMEDLEEFGIRVKIKVLPLADLLNAVFAQKKFQAALFFYSNLYPIDFDSLMWTKAGEGHFNFSSYFDADVESSLSAARYAMGEGESLSSYKRYQRAIHDDPPMVFLVWRDQNLICNRRVHGLNSDPFHFYSDMNRVWVEPQ
jgi:peptide/nickel transport system substrate-binding protein